MGIMWAITRINPTFTTRESPLFDTQEQAVQWAMEHGMELGDIGPTRTSNRGISPYKVSTTLGEMTLTFPKLTHTPATGHLVAQGVINESDMEEQ